MELIGMFMNFGATRARARGHSKDDNDGGEW
jgi:hypothetical protein